LSRKLFDDALPKYIEQSRLEVNNCDYDIQKHVTLLSIISISILSS